MKNRKIYIKANLDFPAFILGIASDEKIWKVCWEVNRELGIDLSTGEKGNEIDPPILVYSDWETDSDFDYQLFEQTEKSRKIPPKARPFRFWLVIRQARDESPDIPQIISKIREIDIVNLVVDLSDEKDIKSLLP